VSGQEKHAARRATCCSKVIIMNVIDTLSDKHVEDLHRMYQAEWWTRGRSLEDTRRCIAGSQVCIGLADDAGNLQGFARVLTDFTFKALVFDVIVSTRQRGTGLGNKLMELLENHDKLKHVKHIELYCLPEMFPFYEKHGFARDVGDIQLMRRTNN